MPADRPRAQTIILLVLLPLLLWPAACRNRNAPRQTEDVAVQVRLERSWLHDNARFHWRSTGWEPSITRIEDLLVIPFALVITGTIEGVVSVSYKTKFVIYPGDRRDYRQRLYWGDNTVYFPADVDPSAAPLRIVVSGDHRADRVITVDLTTHTRIALR